MAPANSCRAGRTTGIHRSGISGFSACIGRGCVPLPKRDATSFLRALRARALLLVSLGSLAFPGGAGRTRPLCGSCRRTAPCWRMRRGRSGSSSTTASGPGRASRRSRTTGVAPCWKGRHGSSAGNARRPAPAGSPERRLHGALARRVGRRPHDRRRHRLRCRRRPSAADGRAHGRERAESERRRLSLAPVRRPADGGRRRLLPLPVGPVSLRVMLGSYLLVFIGVSGLLHGVPVSSRFGGAMAAVALLAAVGAVFAAIAPVYPVVEPVAFALALSALAGPFDRGSRARSGSHSDRVRSRRAACRRRVRVARRTRCSGLVPSSSRRPRWSRSGGSRRSPSCRSACSPSRASFAHCRSSTASASCGRRATGAR